LYRGAATQFVNATPLVPHLQLHEESWQRHLPAKVRQALTGTNTKPAITPFSAGFRGGDCCGPAKLEIVSVPRTSRIREFLDIEEENQVGDGHMCVV
jgi:hypothetical protein